MKKAVVVFAAAALSMTAVCSPESAEARRGRRTTRSRAEMQLGYQP